MKLTKTKLRTLIREEIQKLNEAGKSSKINLKNFKSINGKTKPSEKSVMFKKNEKTIIKHFQNVEFKDAEIVVKGNKIIWNNGTWHNGTWNNGIWKNGIWNNGTWNNGTWEDGIWKDGAWKDGTWVSGIWQEGTWESKKQRTK